MLRYIILIMIAIPHFAWNQSLDDALNQFEAQIITLDSQRTLLVQEVEDIKLRMIQRDLKSIGLPSSDYIMHHALALEYSEDHEQAQWVAHIIRPEVIDGKVFRSNDFRPDPKVLTGTAVEKDYFLKTLKADSTYSYDGFGFDRGHLAPSADFRWSAKALSESYFYSNMSPQRPEFNREGWAELEGLLRAYIHKHPTSQLYVVTGPVLRDDLPSIERSVNKVSIPDQYFKVILDVDAQQAIGFLMPNNAIKYPVSYYAVSIDEIETLTGLDFFNKAQNQQALEKTFDKKHWVPLLNNGNVEPLHPPTLPQGHFNTVQAKRYIGKKKTIAVCGTVVGSRYSRKGHLWFNLDQKFPNQVFSVFIRKEDLVNFADDPQKAFDGKVIAVKGEIQDFNGVPTIKLKLEERIRVMKR